MREPGRPAIFGGTCRRCEYRYEPGDRIVPSGRGYVHIFCAGSFDDE